jgi:branched-chain amino acid transport system substrate-binding protein
LVVPSLDLLLDHLGHQNGMLAITFPAWETQASHAVRGHPSKKVALEFIRVYEVKCGAVIYNIQFAATAWGLKLQLDKEIPLALKQAKPGTREFRLALMQSLETMGETVVPQGVLRDSAKDDYGYEGRARFVLTAKNGNGQAAP